MVKYMLAFVIVALTTMPVHAEQIIPVTVYNLGFTGHSIGNTVPIPQGAYEIAGWSGFASFPSGVRPGWLAIVFWHDGGTPHALEYAYMAPEFQALVPRMFPAGDGHRATMGDLVYANFYCGPGGTCGAGATFYFRVR